MRRASLSSSTNKCSVCGKSVYAMEELKADEKIYHKNCFRCFHCNGVMKLGSYASMDGNTYCKPDFIKLFKSKVKKNKKKKKNQPTRCRETTRTALASSLPSKNMT
jgi:hypothetical protein